MGDELSIEGPGVALTLRAARPEDAPFQYALFCARRAGPFRLAGVAEPTLENLLSTMHRARAASYGQAHPGALWLIAEGADGIVGELVVDPGPDTLHIVDITLAPERQRRGCGPALIEAVMKAMAPRDSVLALIDVANTPSRKMFSRLGFAERPYDEVQVEARWRRRQAPTGGR